MELPHLVVAINCASLRYHRTEQAYLRDERMVHDILAQYFSELGKRLALHTQSSSVDAAPIVDTVEYTLEAFSASLYRTLCKTHHPDRHCSSEHSAKHEVMTRINAAYAEAQQGKLGALLACCHELYDEDTASYMSVSDMQNYYRSISQMTEALQQRYDALKASPRYILAMRLICPDALAKTAQKVAYHMQAVA